MLKTEINENARAGSHSKPTITKLARDSIENPLVLNTNPRIYS